jgi:formylglycine-generating enzyme required for sulfatase activity
MNRLCIKIYLTLVLSVFYCTSLFGTDLRIDGLTWYIESFPQVNTSYCVFNIQWDNSWSNSKNHDAAWVFLKYVRHNEEAIHTFLAPEGVKIITDHSRKNEQYMIKVAKDNRGFFIYPLGSYRGKVHLTLRVAIDVSNIASPGSSQSFRSFDTELKAFGIEMVHIPSAKFYLGEPDSTIAKKFNALYQSTPEGKHNGLFEIKDERQEITVGQGGLLYSAANTRFQGDMKGTVSREFPKGVNSFFCMKYELTQGQYAEFLNTLSPSQTATRSNIGGRTYYQLRGSIRYNGERYTCENPKRPCNFLSWDDAMAYADWACLRPMTELEYVKAARGTEVPKPKTFPWGTDSKEKLQRHVSQAGDLELLNGMNEAELSEQNKEIFGASWYWVMDLAGSLWERVITIGDEVGRKFTGLHGDGVITFYGNANVIGWPAGMEEAGGFGFLGGGFYTRDRSYHEYNPFSPVSYRVYGAWSGGGRTESYGSRFVRTE